MHFSVVKLILLTLKKIAKKFFEKFRGFIDALLNIVIICTNQRISEIPRMCREKVVVSVEAKLSYILYKKYRRSSGIAFWEWYDGNAKTIYKSPNLLNCCIMKVYPCRIFQ